MGIIVGGNTYTDPGMSDALAGDIRSYQWRRDGVTWERDPVLNAQGILPVMADYSPFAVTEFRDWLLHTGSMIPIRASSQATAPSLP